jgi:inosine-uridine nucleoside N-ribohydrolase
MSNPQVYIDTDNAMGSSRGDVDDGFAIAAMLCSQLSVLGISSVSGNTDAFSAHQNNKVLAKITNYKGSLYCGESDSKDLVDFMCKYPGAKILALGPMTNIANALDNGAQFSEVIIVGGNSTSKGFLEPIWPMEFNLCKDKKSWIKVFQSDVPITIVPLNQAKRLRFNSKKLAELNDFELGKFLGTYSRRWLIRNRIVKARNWFPIWDLVAAMYLINPADFKIQQVNTRLNNRGFLRFNNGHRSVRMINDFDPDLIWKNFCRLLS